MRVISYAELEALKETEAALRTELEEINRQLDEMRQQAEPYKASHKRVMDEIDSCQKEIDSIMAEIKSKISGITPATVGPVRQKLASLKQRYEQFDATRRDLRQQSDRLVEAINEIVNRHNALHSRGEQVYERLMATRAQYERLAAQQSRPSPNRRETQSREPGRYVGVKAGFHEKTQTPVTDIVIDDKATGTHRHVGIDDQGKTIFDRRRNR